MFAARAAFIAAALVCLSTVNANAVPAFVGSDIELLWGPEEDYPVKTVIRGGTEVDVESCSDEWCFVRVGGYEGFVPRVFLNFLSPQPAPYLQVYPGYYSNGGYVYGPAFTFPRFGGNYDRRPYRNYPDWRQRNWQQNNQQNWQQRNWQNNQRNWQQNNQQRNWQQNNQQNWQQKNWQNNQPRQQNGPLGQQNNQQNNWQQNKNQQNFQQRNIQQNNQQQNNQQKNWQQNNQQRNTQPQITQPQQQQRPTGPLQKQQ